MYPCISRRFFLLVIFKSSALASGRVSLQGTSSASTSGPSVPGAPHLLPCMQFPASALVTRVLLQSRYSIRPYRIIYTAYLQSRSHKQTRGSMYKAGYLWHIFSPTHVSAVPKICLFIDVNHHCRRPISNLTRTALDRSIHLGTALLTPKLPGGTPIGPKC